MSKTAADHEVLLICYIPHLVFEAGRGGLRQQLQLREKKCTGRRKKKKAKSSGNSVYCTERLTWLATVCSKYMADQVN